MTKEERLKYLKDWLKKNGKLQQGVSKSNTKSSGDFEKEKKEKG